MIAIQKFFGKGSGEEPFFQERFSPVAILLSLFAFSAVAVPPEEAVSTFEIHPDFQIELVAHEPTILDPVDLEFDAQGRMFVIEFPGYPFPEKPGDLILLEDNDDDGVYETRKVWASNFPVATSLMPYEGGLLVASPPDILYLKDTDGDDRADHREVVLTGFAVDNQQHNISGLTLGLDHWIYVQNGGNSGKVHFPDAPDDAVNMRYDDLRFTWSTDTSKPRKVERYGRTTGGFELAQDNYGRIFGTHNTQHIQQLVFPGKYLEGIPAPRHGSLAQISNHEEGGLARIYPIGPQETRVNHPEQSGYFSGACGITFYNGGRFGQFNDAMFICDVVLNLVHVDLLKHTGAPALTATRDAASPKSDFLASTDRAFRPVNATVGPDGALYILDMHRDVIEHPEWIPDEIEETLDVNAGKDKGRIFRISPVGIELPPVEVDLTAAEDDHLAILAGVTNGWIRNTAQRLLIERNAIGQQDFLEETLDRKFGTHESYPAVHALWTLHHLGILSEATLTRALAVPEPRLQENALWIAEHYNESEAIKNALTELDLVAMSPRSRMILALVSGETGFESTLQNDLLLDIALKDIDDEWSRLAIATAVGIDPNYMVHEILSRDALYNRNGANDMLSKLFMQAGRGTHVGVMCGMLHAAVTKTDGRTEQQLAALDGLIDGLNGSSIDQESTRNNKYFNTAVDHLLTNSDLRLQRRGWQLANRFGVVISPERRAQLGKSAESAADASLAVDDRLAHLAMTEFDTPENRVPLLFSMIDPLQPAPLQEAAIAQLASIRNQNVAQQLLDRWDTLGPKIRRAASNILLYQARNHDLLLTALENGTLTLGEMNFHLERRRTLLHSRDEDIVARAEKLFSDAGVVTRKEALESMRPALAMNGRPDRGHEIFTELCATCHTVGTEGADLGPNLTEIFRKSSETLLHDIVDPNAGADLRYITYNVETNDGNFYSGIVIADDETGVTLRDAENEHFIARTDIKEFFSSGLSLMPEELEVGMDPQEMADLLAFLQEPK